MIGIEAWGNDLLPEDNAAFTCIALETFFSDLTQDAGSNGTPGFFKPVNTSIQDGVYYTTIYVCTALDQSKISQGLGIWLASLKSTDLVHLTVTSLVADVHPGSIFGLMSALISTRATINIHLDQIVVDSLAYFYLAIPKVTRGSEGGLFVPSYADQRREDKSGTWHAMMDFYQWVVDMAVQRGRLTQEEATKLHNGEDVIVPMDRF